MNKTQIIRVITVDDHEIMRSGIAFSLQAFKDLELVGEAPNGNKALQLCGELEPDVVLMDMQMAGMDGVQTTQAIREKYPEVQVLALTSFYDKNLVQRALQAGASGYLVKGVSAQELAKVIRLVYSGNMILAQEASQALIQMDVQPSKVGDDLTDRELEVLALLAEGLSNAEIAQQLTISTSTAKHHVRAIRSKLSAANRAEAVSLAMRHDLI
jgi:NarL family two-component system response regulator LiaR